MNIIEKRKSQFKFIGAIILAISVILAVVGVILLVNAFNGDSISVLKLVFGIILIIVGICGIALGISLSWIASAVKATKGSIAENNLGKGTENMHKCENCGVEIEAGKTFCAKCEENLKP